MGEVTIAAAANPQIPANPQSATQGLRAVHVYAMAAASVALGLVIGYVGRGIQLPQAQPSTKAVPVSSSVGASPHGHTVTLAQMKQVADKQAAPLIVRLKSDPNNSALLAQLGAIYHSTHQFDQAAACYKRAVEIDPKNVALRTKLASSLYRSGDADGAIAQLNTALTEDPKDANTLFDLGMIRLQGKHDAQGAVAAWQKLLKTNPQLSAAQKSQVQSLMAQAVAMLGDQQGVKGERADARR